MIGILFASALAVDAGGPLPLTPIHEERLREHVAWDGAAIFDGPVEAGARLPLAADLHALPGPLMIEVPALRTLRYLRLRAGFALVDSDTRRVVQVFGGASLKPVP